jgi:hypothetical protein
LRAVRSSQQLEDAERRTVDVSTREKVTRGLADANLLYRARVVEALGWKSDLAARYVPSC